MPVTPGPLGKESPRHTVLAELLDQVAAELGVDARVVRRLAEQVAASDPGQFAPHEVSAMVHATVQLCHSVGVDPDETGPHVLETVLGFRAIKGS